MMATYLADLVIVAERRGSNHSVINPPCPLNIGMNRFLSVSRLIYNFYESSTKQNYKYVLSVLAASGYHHIQTGSGRLRLDTEDQQVKVDP